MARPLPDSGIREFGQWILTEEWTEVSAVLDPSEQVAVFKKMVSNEAEI